MGSTSCQAVFGNPSLATVQAEVKGMSDKKESYTCPFNSLHTPSLASSLKVALGALWLTGVLKTLQKLRPGWKKSTTQCLPSRTALRH